MNAANLHTYIENKEWDKVQRAIRNSYDVESLLNSRVCGTTDNALMLALYHGAPDRVIFNIISGYEQGVFYKNSSGATALHFAILCGASYKVIEKLIQKNPRALDARNVRSKTPRDYLCKTKMDEKTRRLVGVLAEKFGVDENSNSQQMELSCSLVLDQEPGSPQSIVTEFREMEDSRGHSCVGEEEELILLQRKINGLEEVVEAERLRRMVLEKEMVEVLQEKVRTDNKKTKKMETLDRSLDLLQKQMRAIHTDLEEAKIQIQDLHDKNARLNAENVLLKEKVHVLTENNEAAMIGSDISEFKNLVQIVGEEHRNLKEQVAKGGNERELLLKYLKSESEERKANEKIIQAELHDWSCKRKSQIIDLCKSLDFVFGPVDKAL